jgi:hypothetical protein
MDSVTEHFRSSSADDDNRPMSDVSFGINARSPLFRRS